MSMRARWLNNNRSTSRSDYVTFALVGLWVLCGLFYIQKSLSGLGIMLSLCFQVALIDLWVFRTPTVRKLEHFQIQFENLKAGETNCLGDEAPFRHNFSIFFNYNKPNLKTCSGFSIFVELFSYNIYWV